MQQLEAYREVPEEIRHIPQLLEKCGVKFVIVEALPSSKIDGVCLWLGDSPVIGMTLRFDRIDNFWFVLRHELEHVLNKDGKETAVLDSDLMKSWEGGGLSREEQVANDAAAEFCVPQAELTNFIARKDPYYSRSDILNFARRLGTHPGLIVGQLQWRTKRYDLFRSMLVSIKDKIVSAAMTDGFGHVIPIYI